MIISMQFHSKGRMDCLFLERVDHHVPELLNQCITLKAKHGLQECRAIIDPLDSSDGQAGPNVARAPNL